MCGIEVWEGASYIEDCCLQYMRYDLEDILNHCIFLLSSDVEAGTMGPPFRIRFQ
jgi:hypothetical protein